MKTVDARLSTGEVVTIKEEWFVTIVDRPDGEWRQCKPVLAHIYGETGLVKIDPSFIVWLKVLEWPRKSDSSV